MRIWLHDRLVEAEAARIDPADRGLLLGDGVFETLRVAGGRIAHAGRHLARLQAAAAFFDIPCPDDAELSAALEAVRAAEGIAEGALRLTLTRGPAPRGLLPPLEARPMLLVSGVAASPPRAGPVSLHIAATTRRNAASPLSRFKTLNTLDNIIALREARLAGCDDALLFNTAGRLAEASAANLLWRDRDGAWFTPPVSDGALPGIRRGLLVEAGLVAERSLDDPGAIVAALLSNSLGLRLVGTLGGRVLQTDERALAGFHAATD